MTFCKMRIALVVEYLNARGGTQRQALELARHLVKDGHEVRIFTKLLDRERCFPEINDDLDIVTVRESGFLPGEPPLQIPQFGQFWKPARYLIRKTGLVYLRDYWVMRQSTQQLVAMVARDHQEHPFDLINPHDYGPAAWAARELAQKLNIPVVWQYNDPLLRWNDGLGWLARLLRRWLVNQDWYHVRGIGQATVLDTQVAQVVRERHNLEPVVVRSGVDFERFQNLPDQPAARAALGLPLDKPVILVLTILNSDHRRVEDVIAAFAQVSHEAWLLLVATIRDPKQEYISVIKGAVSMSPAQSRIVWLKHPLRNENELLSLYAAADLFVFPNMQQIWGLAVIEAAAAGLPVVVSDGAGVHEVFTSGENGFCYRGGDIDDLSVKLNLLINDKLLCKRMGWAGRRLVQERFSWSRYAADMATVFAREISYIGNNKPVLSQAI